jgi:hypothetical protein
VEDHAEGYPRISAYINSDEDTVLFRRFGTLTARSLLYKTVEITALEEKLKKMDNEDGLADNNSWKNKHSTSYNGGYMNLERKALMEEIDRKLASYRT